MVKSIRPFLSYHFEKSRSSSDITVLPLCPLIHSTASLPTQIRYIKTTCCTSFLGRSETSYRPVNKNAAGICMIHTAVMHEEMVWFDPSVGVEWGPARRTILFSGLADSNKSGQIGLSLCPGSDYYGSWEIYLADAKLHVKSHPDIPTQSTTALIYS
jgi:hypothetical protein